MAKFRYIGKNKDGKEVNDVIEASSEANARMQLGTYGRRIGKETKKSVVRYGCLKRKCDNIFATACDAFEGGLASFAFIGSNQQAGKEPLLQVGFGANRRQRENG